ncbi:MAG: class I SAM-dependent methyltransferase [Luteolibacter sp.]|uniref:class I SAM-dependent methyltransferase n=1 Tax=Luteolibacter sp. TaxID=1962973 RepID=UPI00326604DF
MTPPKDPIPVEIDPFYAEDLRQMERAVNYRDWQFRMVEPFLGRRVLEIGGGIGNFTPQLAGNGRKVTSLEPNEFCFRQLEEKTRELCNVRPLRATVESLDTVLAPEERFDSVVLMNVLEHIQDDRAVLNTLKQRLATGGRLIVLVPAGPWAHGPIDERLGHYRRYSKSCSRILLQNAGLSLEFMRYYNFIGIWGWWWNAKMGKLEGQNDAQIRFFDRWVVPLASRIERLIRPPVGQSILFVSRNIES